MYKHFTKFTLQSNFMKKTFFLLILLVFQNLVSQEIETNSPYNIKTISFVQNGINALPIFQLNDSFQLQFDDLHGSEDNYYFKITHCDYNWKKSQLTQNEYLNGFDEQRIQDYVNSQNTLQVYSHYRITFPNRFVQLKVSGNYLISILNENKELVFSRKLILYEDMVSVPMQIKRARNVRDLQFKHNVDFAVKSNVINFQSPLQNVKVLLLQNGKMNNVITNVKPQFTIANDLIYKYDKETQFWAGNEYLFFENKNIQSSGNNISFINSNGGLYNSHLFTNNARAFIPYTYFPDYNGNFIVKNLVSQNPEIESDYAWVYFSLLKSQLDNGNSIYVTGLFNNYAISDENKMEFNSKSGLYEKAIMIKQGFTNFSYTIINSAGKLDEENAIDGNFFQTENNYIALIYYRENNQRYDRIIGKGSCSSVDITN